MPRPARYDSLDALVALEAEHGSLQKAAASVGLSARSLQRYARKLGRPASDSRERSLANLMPGGHNKLLSDQDLVDGLVVHDGNNSALARTLGSQRESVSRRRSQLPPHLKLELAAKLQAYRAQQAARAAAQSTRTGAP